MSIATQPKAGLALIAQRWSLLSLQALARRISRRKPLPPHLQVGMRGELEALFFLRRLGFTVIERRWRSPELNGDLDLIAWEQNTLCFVEVKTRTARDMTPAALAVDTAKQNMLRRMARSYRRTLPEQYREDLLIRFDVVSAYLLGDRIELEILRDAFER